ncbi:MAG: hypothetical protein QOC81_1444 [Thermoanaerobaculia bacterium]|nr:hypothetical protein [Thermoanaerobaculia bacterium]
MKKSVSSHKQVRDDSQSRGTSLTPEIAPKSSCHRRRVHRDRIELNTKESESFGKGIVGLEMCPHLGPDDFAGNESTGVVSLTEGFSRFPAVNGVGAQNIQKD